jgi:CheY-like chemotaxis protein
VKRVLIVDDDAEIRDMLLHVVGQQELAVDGAGDGREALDLMAQHRYDVIVLDLLMPVLNGFEFLAGLEMLQLEAQPVVLVITGAERDLERLDPQRIHGIVRKPFDADELARLVAACAEIRSRSAFGTMAIATMIAGGPLLALLDQFRT